MSITNPEWKPPPVLKLALHGPHHAAATYSTPPTVTASSAVTSDAALPPSAVRVSNMFCHEVVPAMPASEFQTIAPPETRWLEFVRSMLIGAMNRGLGSGGTMKCQLAPPSVDLSAVRPTYSVMTFFELLGSTMVYPPSPPNTCTELTVMLLFSFVTPPLSANPGEPAPPLSTGLFRTNVPGPDLVNVELLARWRTVSIGTQVGPAVISRRGIGR